ncbi:calcium/calmodulin-dependent protein kinase type IV [Clonorchis sinensis]|uniref:Calcium/calmodulin-dependent protein kinase type IV n=1 Tax=Clonorchis sinensis TaxID=79923 RepID=G7YUV6_CLOSI|nr:calcium/calmodulin-dependent protein kinase type IV [Clonorchis sinensis]
MFHPYRRAYQPNGSGSYVAACIERGTKYLFATKALQKKVRLREVFETSAFLYLVYEFVDGEQLFHRLSELKDYTEMTIAGYFRQIVEGLRYLHEYGIVHKNLKPENLVLSSRDENAVVKITDAALHNFMIEDMDIEVLCCNTIFCAPELLTSRIFDKTFDLWALGIILHIMLCGSDPYFPKADAELYRAILNGELLFDNEAWEKVSWNGRDVVRGLLVVDPPQRLNTVQVLEHPWVSGRHTPSEPHLELSQSQLVQFVERRKEWIGAATAGNKAEDSKRISMSGMDENVTNNINNGNYEEPTGGPKHGDIAEPDALEVSDVSREPGGDPAPEQNMIHSEPSDEESFQ